jgi:hypothetical protein
MSEPRSVQLPEWNEKQAAEYRDAVATFVATLPIVTIDTTDWRWPTPADDALDDYEWRHPDCDN